MHEFIRVDMLLFNRFLLSDINIFLTLTMYQEKQGCSIMISGIWPYFW